MTNQPVDQLSHQLIDPLTTRPPDHATKRLTWPLLVLLLAALAFGAYFRFVGLDWNEGIPLHPDEYFLRDVTSRIRPPESLWAYFDSKTSTLNPYNNNFGLFVYGDLPVFITRYTADILDNLCKSVTQVCLKSNNVPVPFSAYDGVYLVGRMLSAVLDLFTLLFIFLIGRRLYNARVGVLAALLGAATVLQIQQSHFYTADIFATFFVVFALYFIVRFNDSNSWAGAIAAGISSGLAVASRINVLPIVGILGLAALAPVLRQWHEPKRASIDGAILRIVVAVVAGVIVFRIFMPYAFDGSESLFDPRWSNNMNYAQALNSGEDSGGPPGAQWTDRAPIIFPWINIVFWGMGVPLGLAAWFAWAWAAWQMFITPYRAHRTGRVSDWLIDVAKSPHLLIWIWVTGYFGYMGSQFVKSIRYELPIYPFLTLFAAAGLMALWDHVRASRRWMRIVSGAVIALVIVGAYAWAFAFTHIYRQTTSRITASRWIYDNVPTALTLNVQQNGSPKSIQLPFLNTVGYPADGAATAAAFKVDQDSIVESVMINHLIDPIADPMPETVRVAISESSDGSNPLDQVDVTANVEQAGPRGGRYEFKFKPVNLQAGKNYFVVTQAVNGAPLQAESSTIAVESWDEAVPVRVEGRDGYSIYHGVEIQRQWEDVPEKLKHLVDILDKSDYVTMSSTRAYGSMGRQPLRYPMTLEYYRLMFTGQLGFKLVATVESYPTLGPFTFPDQETTQGLGLWPDPTRCPQAGVPQCHGLINVPMPPAEEAFGVYDHPRVLVFEKTSAFSAQDVTAKLSRIPLRDVLRDITPKAESAAPNGLLLKDDVWQAQQETGAWSDLFDRNSILNQSPLIGAIVWYLLVALLGVIAFPILFAIAPGLRDRGYGVARITGVLIVSFVVWLAANYRVVPFTRGAIALTAIVLAIVSGFIAWRQRADLRSFLKGSRRVILIEEALFGAAFVWFLVVRFGNPDLWHPVMGGEKPMDFAYLNAVIKSQYFPPYDAWFADGQITYYYFGFVLVATLIKLLGIIPAIAYNFTIPTLFAMTALGAFCVAFNLVSHFNPKSKVEQPKSRLRNPIVVGIIAAVFVTFIGNLGEAQLLSEEMIKLGGSEFKSSIPGVERVVNTAVGLSKMVFEGKELSFRPEWWYFTPTREIPASQGEAGPISEFPYFTFLYADLHAHMIALPLTLLILALAVGWLVRLPMWSWGGIGSIVLGGLTVGALRVTNSADYPTYLLIGAAALFIGTITLEPLNMLSTWARLLVRLVAFAAVSAISFRTLMTQADAYSSIEMWKGSVTPLWAYLNIHLLFLFPIVTFGLWEFRRWGWRWWRRLWKWGRSEWRVILIAAGLALMVLFALVYRVHYDTPLPPDPTALYDRQTIFVILPILALIALLIIRPRLPSAERFWFFLVAVAVGLTFAVEVIVVKGDISRMNTTFKFYMQVWVLLGIAAAVALGWLADRLAAWKGWGKALWSTAMWTLAIASFLYVPLATRGKINDRFVPDMPPGFDGINYMTQATYDDTGKPYALKWDHDLITWMQDNIKGTPVIVEGNSPLYHWGSRISINTGLPTIIGWDWHQRQQRAIMPGQVIDNRLVDVRTLYEGLDIPQAKDLLDRYHARYIVVGPLERSFYIPMGLEKFDRMVEQGLLRVAYRNDQAILYEVIR